MTEFTLREPDATPTGLSNDNNDSYELTRERIGRRMFRGARKKFIIGDGVT